MLTTVAIALIVLLISWRILYPKWLTWMHGAEMRFATQRYLALHSTIEGWTDPSVMAQVATGEYLEYLIRSRCVDCLGVEVSTGIQIETVDVLEYGSSVSKVHVRYEGAWQMIDPQTRDVIGQCNVGVYENVLIMNRENNDWKVSGGEDFHSKVISNDEFTRLQTKYCAK
jgi:hypothetical protein